MALLSVQFVLVVSLLRHISVGNLISLNYCYAIKLHLLLLCTLKRYQPISIQLICTHIIITYPCKCINFEGNAAANKLRLRSDSFQPFQSSASTIASCLLWPQTLVASHQVVNNQWKLNCNAVAQVLVKKKRYSADTHILHTHI